MMCKFVRIKQLLLMAIAISVVITSASAAPININLHKLSHQFGGRPTGSKNLARALQWARERFLQDAKVDTVGLEEYIAPVNWLPEQESAEIVFPYTKSLRMAMMPFTSSTPEAGITADVFTIAEMDANLIYENKSKIKNHWLLIQTPRLIDGETLALENLLTASIFKAAESVGAAGILWMSSHDNKRLYRHAATFNGTISKLPGMVIEREQAQNIIKQLASRRVMVHANLLPKITYNDTSYNVVAEIKGDEKPNEVIVIGAHLDSWDLGQGALDNGCNAVMLIEVAKEIAKQAHAGKRPHRTIRFMLFTGEENGLYGSWHDVQNRINELDAIKAVLVFDMGSGAINGFSLGGRSDMIDLVTSALKPVGKFAINTDAFLGTDNFDYLLHGIPTIVAEQNIQPYLPHYHANTDVYENVDLKQLAINTKVATMLVLNLANTQYSYPKRYSKQEVEKQLHDTHLDEEMMMADITYR